VDQLLWLSKRLLAEGVVRPIVVDVDGWQVRCPDVLLLQNLVPLCHVHPHDRDDDLLDFLGCEDVPLTFEIVLETLEEWLALAAVLARAVSDAQHPQLV
jgi:hypothetical protein